MARKDVDLSLKFGEETISQVLRKKYEEFHSKDFIREEEFREKIMILCKNKELFDLNKKDENMTTFLIWAIEKGYGKMVKSLLTLPNLKTDYLDANQTMAFEKLRN